MPAHFAQLGVAVIEHVLQQRHQRVGGAGVLDGSAFRQLHKAVARAALPVAGGTVAGNVSVFDQGLDHLERAALI